jgi:hypothetical protein
MDCESVGWGVFFVRRMWSPEGRAKLLREVKVEGGRWSEVARVERMVRPMVWAWRVKDWQRGREEVMGWG